MNPSTPKHDPQPKCQMVSDGNDIFVVFDGVKIAKRGQPGTPHAGTWVSLEPGFVVRDREGAIVVEHNGVQVH